MEVANPLTGLVYCAECGAKMFNRRNRSQAELEASIAEGEKKLAVYDSETDRAAQFLALARKYTDFTELTTPMIYELFVGKFDVPRPEPTAEEPEKLEKDRQHRAYKQEKARRCAPRKKQRQEAAAV